MAPDSQDRARRRVTCGILSGRRSLVLNRSISCDHFLVNEAIVKVLSLDNESGERRILSQ